MTSPPTATNWFCIFALSLIWGGAFMAVSLALDGYAPLTVAAGRCLLGCLALIVLTIALRRPLPTYTPKLLRYLIAIGLTNAALPFALLSWGIQYVPSAFAGISMAAVPLCVLPLAHFFSDERLTSRNATGMAVGFIGALVLIGPALLQLGTGVAPLAQLACVGAAVAYAVSSVLTRRCPPIDPIVLAAAVMIVGSVALIPLALLIEGPPKPAPLHSTLALIGLGLLPTGLAGLLRVLVIRSAGSIFMSLVSYQVPLWSMLFGVLILNETLPLRFFAALGLIFIGLAISQWHSLRQLRL